MPFRINPFTGTLSPVVRDLSVSNTNTKLTLYLKGDEFTNGSIRLRVNDGEILGHIEMRAEGVWNDTGFRFSAGSIEVGRGLKIEAIVHFLKIAHPAQVGGFPQTLLSHIPFNDTGTKFLHTAILDKKKTTVIYETAVSEIVGLQINVSFNNPQGRAISQIIHEVGSVVSLTKEIVYSVYIGTDNTGPLIYQLTRPASDFVPNTPLTITFPSELGILANNPLFIELICFKDFSLKTDSGGNILTTIVEQPLDILGIVTENIMLDENLGTMYDENFNPMYEIQFA